MSRYSFQFSTEYQGGEPAPHFLSQIAEQVRDQISPRERDRLRGAVSFGRRQMTAASGCH